MNDQDEYQHKLISSEDAAGLVKSGMGVDYGFVCGFPLLIDEKLTERAIELEGVIIRAYMSLSEPQVLKVDREQKHFIYNSWLFSAVERKYHDAGACSYIPSNFGETPRIYREYLKEKADIAFIGVTPMDGQGYFNFGLATSYHKALCEVARTVVIEVNESQPWIYGGCDESIHISQIDYIVENNKYKVPELPVPPMTKTDESIAEHVVERIGDGATIQFGIGIIPGAVGKMLVKSGKKDLGIHTGVFIESMADLIETGVVTGEKKNLNPGKAVFTCAMGTRKLYEYMNRNNTLAGFPVDYTHNPYIISQNWQQIAVNSALRIDLQGQVSSESSGSRHISGTGGQLEFTRGAYMSPGGKAFICLRSSHTDKAGKLISNVVPVLPLGEAVTVPETDVSYVVTEHGVVNLKGKSSWERAKSLISIAHPDFRAGLEEAAGKAKLLTRGTRHYKLS